MIKFWAWMMVINGFGISLGMVNFVEKGTWFGLACSIFGLIGTAMAFHSAVDRKCTSA